MANHPEIRGIPFYTGTATDSSSFAPVYDPQAIRFARKVNFAIATAISLAAVTLAFLLLSTPALSAATHSANTAVRVSSSFILPIILFTIGFRATMLLTPRIGFDLPRAYSATADALRAWLPSTAGDYPKPKKDLLEELKENFATREDSLRFLLEADGNSFLHQAARGIARQSPEAYGLLSKDHRNSTLRLDATGRYELITD